jgi:hypothetical protein
MKKIDRTLLRHPIVSALLIVASVGHALPVEAKAELPIMGGYAEQAKTLVQGFAGFSADRGRTLFSATHATGKPETPSCTSCHTTSPMKTGRTRAGKEISPMAISSTPDRYADAKKVEKWFRRNCKSVLGRTCTPLEKGDFLTFMMSQ